MFMKEMKECHEVLDQADPFTLEIFNSRTDEQLLDIKVRELKMRDIYIARGKSLLEIDAIIKVVDTVLTMRYLKKALADFDERDSKGESPADGYSVV